MSSTLSGAAAGATLPALFLFMLAVGVESTVAAALCACAALALPPAGHRALVGAATGALASALLLLPTFGIWGTMGVAAALAAFDRRSQRPVEPKQAGLPAFQLAAATIGILGVWRVFAFLLGHTLYAATAAAAAAALGAAAGRRWRETLEPARAVLPGGGALCAGLAGLLLLNALRVLGLNGAEPERVRAAVLGWGDAMWLCLLASAGLAAICAALISLAEEAPSEGRFPTAVAAPAAAAAGFFVFGAAGTAGCGFLALALLGAAAGRTRWTGHPILSRVVPAGLLAGALLTWTARSALHDIATVRLNAVYPGGRVLLWSEGLGPTLAVYRFSTGLRVVLRDGVADFVAGELAFLEVLLPLMAHAHPVKTVLVTGMLHPEAAAAATMAGARPVLHDRHHACAQALSLGSDRAAPVPSEFTVVCGGAPPLGRFDVVIAQIDPPAWSPENALRLTPAAVASLKSRLSEGGVLALRLPGPADSREAKTAVAAMRLSFPAVAVSANGPGTIVLAAATIPDDIITPLASASPALQKQAPGLFQTLVSTAAPWTRPAADSARPVSRWRPLAALPARLLP